MGIVESLSNIANFPMIMMVLVVVLALLVMFLLYYVVSRHVAASKTYRVIDTLYPTRGDVAHRFRGDRIPKMNNGTRFSVAFWIYILDFSQNQGMLRNVFWRGGSRGENPCPHVFLHESENKISIQFTANKDKPAWVDTNMRDMSSIDKAKYLSGVYGLTIDDLPSNRWVHVAFVVSDNIKGVYCNGFIDGELVKTINKASKIDKVDGVVPVSDLEHIDLSLQGDIYMGSSETMTGFAGYISKLSFTNSDLNPNDIYELYLDTPVPINPITKAGYGIQSPLYRLG